MSIADRMSDMGGGGMKKAVPVKKMGAARGLAECRRRYYEAYADDKGEPS